MNETIKYLIWAVINKEQLAPYERAQMAELLEKYDELLEYHNRIKGDNHE